MKRSNGGSYTIKLVLVASLLLYCLGLVSPVSSKLASNPDGRKKDDVFSKTGNHLTAVKEWIEKGKNSILKQPHWIKDGLLVKQIPKILSFHLGSASLRNRSKRESTKENAYTHPDEVLIPEKVPKGRVLPGTTLKVDKIPIHFHRRKRDITTKSSDKASIKAILAEAETASKGAANAAARATSAANSASEFAKEAMEAADEAKQYVEDLKAAYKELHRVKSKARSKDSKDDDDTYDSILSGRSFTSSEEAEAESTPQLSAEPEKVDVVTTDSPPLEITLPATSTEPPTTVEKIDSDASQILENDSEGNTFSEESTIDDSPKSSPIDEVPVTTTEPSEIISNESSPETESKSLDNLPIIANEETTAAPNTQVEEDPEVIISSTSSPLSPDAGGETTTAPPLTVPSSSSEKKLKESSQTPIDNSTEKPGRQIPPGLKKPSGKKNSSGDKRKKDSPSLSSTPASKAPNPGKSKDAIGTSKRAKPNKAKSSTPSVAGRSISDESDEDIADPSNLSSKSGEILDNGDHVSDWNNFANMRQSIEVKILMPIIFCWLITSSIIFFAIINNNK
ncbi:unnamed protein product [Orchesella dallaii]|uniref:Zonadhesin n=1 Tax=Orchesella dallaii TaxID=48710 RepID=A0ABP1R693_9HEXA